MYGLDAMRLSLAGVAMRGSRSECWLEPHAPLLPAMSLVIDAREMYLLRVYQGPHTVETLPVGDLKCTYDDGRTWLGERKTAQDLANSIKDGRWACQRDRLLASGCQVVYVVEGDLAAARFPYASLLGAIVNANLQKNSFVFRTFDLDETARLIGQLVVKLSRCPGMPSALRPPLRSKRKRDAEAETVWTRQLMCVPSISQRVSEALIAHFGSLPRLVRALGETEFPQVRLDGRSCVGKARIKRLRAYLVE